MKENDEGLISILGHLANMLRKIPHGLEASGCTIAVDSPPPARLGVPAKTEIPRCFPGVDLSMRQTALSFGLVQAQLSNEEMSFHD
jgi:hypothetical protein